MSSIRVDTRGIDEFVVEMGKAKHALLGRLAERGYQLLRREIRQPLTRPEIFCKASRRRSGCRTAHRTLSE
ncbi:MAG: hypothetical protein IPN69_08250 [Acidobacteria bacterium]|nr:hypothetical protein [Acidobacteriota bacterium]